MTTTTTKAPAPTFTFGRYAVRTFSAAPILEHGAATLYSCGMFGTSRIEVKQLVAFVGAYAQYSKAIQVVYVEKGKRRPQQAVMTYAPSLVIFDGYGHAEPGSPFVATGGGCFMTTRASYDPVYRDEHDTLIERVTCEGGVILADYRGYNAH